MAWIEIAVAARGDISAKRGHCRQPAPGYDHPELRAWLFVPLWVLAT